MGCSDRSEGYCTDCESNDCPQNTYASSCHECSSCGSCNVGEFRDGCSGDSPGTCEACSNLTCPNGEWLKDACDGTGFADTSSCETCGFDSFGAPQCHINQYVDGCGNTSAGT